MKATKEDEGNRGKGNGRSRGTPTALRSSFLDSGSVRVLNCVAADSIACHA